MKPFIFIIGYLLLWLMPASVRAAGGAGHEFPLMPLIYAGINFTLLLLIMGYLLRKPAKDFFASRSALIQQDIDESQELKKAATQKYQEYEAKLNSIEQEMNSLQQTLQESGEAEKQKLIQSAQEQASELQSTSQRLLDNELKKAKEELKQQAVVLAAELASELIKSNMGSQDQERLVKRYMEKMEQLS